MGAVNIDNTGTGSAVTLSSNGTQLLLNGSAVGGGASAITIDNKTGAYTVVAGDLGKIINCTANSFTVSLTAAATLGAGFYCWIWNTSSTSTSAITIDPNGSETIDDVSTIVLRCGEGCEIVSNGTNWQTGAKKAMRGYAENIGNNSRPSVSGDGGIALGVSAQANGILSGAFLGTAGSSYSTAVGQNSGGNRATTATGAGAMALGGSYASGADSFAAAVKDNTSSYGATGTSSIAIGDRAKGTNSNTIAIGSVTSSTGANGSSAIGYSVTASGAGSFAQGYINTASGAYSQAIGQGARASEIGKFAKSANNFVDYGDMQYGLMVLVRATTDATATVLTSNKGTPDTTNQLVLPNNGAFAFTGRVVARQKAANGTASAAWKIEGLIRREGAANTTTLVASTVTAISNVPGWTLALSADTTNGCLKIEATGAAATNIYWVATVETSETYYA